MSGRERMRSGDPQIVYQILDAVAGDEAVSQRSLAARLGISVGSVNWYLKRCVAKGLIKLRHAPVKRYLYYLTPKGFEEKARLTARFMRNSLTFFRQGRAESLAFFQMAQRAGLRRILLAGDGEFAEIAALSALEMEMPLAGVIDPQTQRQHCIGLTIYPSLRHFHEAYPRHTLSQAESTNLSPRATGLSKGSWRPDAIWLTDLQDPAGLYRKLRRELAELGWENTSIHIPKMLQFSPTSPTYEETITTPGDQGKTGEEFSNA